MYRIDILLKQKRELFHTGDLALIWQIKNKNTLYTAIKRYVKKGILIPIHKGFYSTQPLTDINPLKLAIGYLHRFAYLSCETILIKAGIVFQKENHLTLISNISKKLKINNRSFLVRKLKDKYLFNDFGIEEKNSLYYAGIERAVADMLYFNHHYFFDNNKAIDWKKVREIQKEVGYR